MKRPHLLRVHAEPSTFEALAVAVRDAGLRFGWLELSPTALPADDLGGAAELGVLRAVAAGGGASVAVKPMVGEPVLEDLLREHFRGCALVLVRGEVAAPSLEREGEGWIVRSEVGAVLRLDSEELAGRLRRPRGFRDDPVADPTAPR